MFTLVELIQELKTLASGDDPDKLEKINALFSDVRAPAEFQVGRHYVATLLAKAVDAQLDSLDPEERKAAIETARLVFPRAAAARAGYAGGTTTTGCVAWCAIWIHRCVAWHAERSRTSA